MKNKRQYVCRMCGDLRVLKVPKKTDKDICPACAHAGQKLHGMSHSKLHRVWSKLRDRCNNKNNADYKFYGGRGISVCKEWGGFKVFYEWSLISGYKEGLTIDRRDNDGNYEPDNCWWATRAQQARNRRTSQITEEYVPVVREMLAAGFRVCEVSTMIGVLPGVITELKSRRSFNDIR